MGSEETLRLIIKAKDEASAVLRGVGDATGKLGGRFGWLETVGTQALRGLWKAAKWAGAAILAVLTLALVKGAKRLIAIENAEASLRGLGHSAKEVRVIMGDALDSVLGTAFGLDEAATVAAAAVAAGIKPGKALEGTLRLVADAATIGKTSMSDMGAIFNRVAATGKAQNDTFRDLSTKGIPVLKFLSKELGVSTAEVIKMGKEGKISFADFSRAMQEGLGGAALASGKTTTGAFKNMMAALGRFGAVLLKDIFPLAKVVFGGIGKELDKLAESVGPVVKKFSKSLKKFLKSEEFADFVRSAGAALKRLGDALLEAGKIVVRVLGFFVHHSTLAKVALSGLAVFIGIAMGYAVALKAIAAVSKAYAVAAKIAAAAQWLWNAAMSANPIGLVVIAIAALVAGLVIAYKKSETFRNIVTAAWDAVKKAAVDAFSAVSNAVSAAWAVIGPIITLIYQHVKSYLIDKLTAAMPTLKVMWAEFVATLKVVWIAVAAWAAQVAGAIAAWAAQVAGAIAAVVGFIRKHWGTIGPIVRTYWNAVEAVVGGALKVIASLIRAVMAALRGDWSAAWGHVKAALKAAWDSMKGVVSNALSALKLILTGLGRKIIGWVGDLGGLLKGAGRAIVQGLWDGISSMTEWLRDKVFGWASSIYDTVKSGLGKLWPGSPSQAGIDLGYFLGLGIEKGIGQSLPRIASAVSTLSSQLALTAGATGSFALAGGAGFRATGGGGRALSIASGAVQVSVSVADSDLSPDQVTSAVRSGVEPALLRLAREIGAL